MATVGEPTAGRRQEHHRQLPWFMAHPSGNLGRTAKTVMWRGGAYRGRRGVVQVADGDDGAALVVPTPSMEG
jgi:hypothetical protein